MSFSEFVDGPFWYFSAAVFAIGVLWRLVGMLALGWKTDLSKARAPASSGAVGINVSRFFPRADFWPRIRLQVVAGYLFQPLAMDETRIGAGSDKQETAGRGAITETTIGGPREVQHQHRGAPRRSGHPSTGPGGSCAEAYRCRCRVPSPHRERWRRRYWSCLFRPGAVF